MKSRVLQYIFYWDTKVGKFADKNLYEKVLTFQCKEVEHKNFSEKEQNELEYVSTTPKGNGWKSFIKFIYSHINSIGLNKIETILPVISDWNSKFKEGNTTKKASLIALKYYALVIENKEEYEYRNHIPVIVKAIINGSYEIKEELSHIFNKIIDKKLIGYRDGYYILLKTILTGVNGVDIWKNSPEYVLKLANLCWSKKNKNTENLQKYNFIEENSIEADFDLEDEDREFMYSPSSAFQTPIYYLLKNRPEITLDFIMKLINKSIEHYATTDMLNIKTIKINIDVNTCIEQFHNERLWNIYRGTSTPNVPGLLESIHMGLEKILLEIAENISSEILERMLLHLLKNSKSSSISSVVSSIVLAYPSKTLNIAIILFGVKEFIQSDKFRNALEFQSKNSYVFGFQNNLEEQIYKEEREYAYNQSHRKKDLASLFFEYQFIMMNDNELEFKIIQTRLWNILDNYYSEIPKKSKQQDVDKNWQITLGVIDRRNQTLKVKTTDDQTVIEFKPKHAPHIKKYIKESSKDSIESQGFTRFYLWAIKKIENPVNGENYEEYENSPLLILKQMRKIEEGTDRDSEMYKKWDLLPCASIILLRDYKEQLSSEDKEFCAETLIYFLIKPLNIDYRYQISDGVEKTIKYIALLLKDFPEIELDLKKVLLLLLFERKEIRNFVIDSINENFNSEVAVFIDIYIQISQKYKEYKASENLKYNNIYFFETLIDSDKNIFEKFLSIENNVIVIKEFENLSYYNLIVIFKMLTLSIEAVEKSSIKKILEIFCENILVNSNNTSYYSLKNEFFEIFALFILKINKNDIEYYIEPIMKNFNNIKNINKLFNDFIFIQNNTPKYENFWCVWQFLGEGIKDIAKGIENDEQISPIIISYLFADDIWTKGVIEWHSLKEKDIRFLIKFTRNIRHCPSTLYSVSKLLTEIAFPYQEQGITWISDLIKNNDCLLNKNIHSNTIIYLNGILRKYIFHKREKIKKDIKIRKNILVILNFLIEKGSELAYILREKII